MPWQRLVLVSVPPGRLAPLDVRVLAAGGKRRAEVLADRSPVWLEIAPKAGMPT